MGQTTITYVPTYITVPNVSPKLQTIFKWLPSDPSFLNLRYLHIYRYCSATAAQMRSDRQPKMNVPFSKSKLLAAFAAAGCAAPVPVVPAGVAAATAASRAASASISSASYT